jgi:hypothetical protein
MNKDNQQVVTGKAVMDAAELDPAVSREPSPSRRRLIRLGAAAVPVVATLASRPALAWHCKSPSAWGSEILNPTTSLRTNPGHQSYPDETWYISTWVGNTQRNGVKPWDKFFSLYTDIKAAASNNYQNVTISQLASKGFNCGTASGTAKVYQVLANGSALQKSTIAAKLNFKCLSAFSSSQMAECLTFANLYAMASGSYSPPGTGMTWNSTRIVQFLYDNWIAR